MSVVVSDAPSGADEVRDWARLEAFLKRKDLDAVLKDCGTEPSLATRRVSDAGKDGGTLTRPPSSLSDAIASRAVTHPPFHLCVEKKKQEYELHEQDRVFREGREGPRS